MNPYTVHAVFSRHRDYRTDRTLGLDSMGGVVWCDESVRIGGTVTTLCRPGFSRRGRTCFCPHFSWSSLERGSAGAIGLTGRGGWTVWYGYMVRRSEQGEQLPLFVDSRSRQSCSRSHYFGERQYGGSGHWGRGLGGQG